MNIAELKHRLFEEGCDPYSYAIEVRGSASDAYCLIHDGSNWCVFYTERGVDQQPFYQTSSEEEACAYFFNYIMQFRHDHWVGFLRSEAAMHNLRAMLTEHGIDSHYDRILYSSKDDVRYRVFVTGKAIFAAKELLGTVPVEDVKRET